MSDVHDEKTRSYNMSQIKGRNTKPETIIRKCLFQQGFRYRLNDKRYPGNPDIVLPKYRTCIFVNGCFWHVHEGCKYFVWPKHNESFWHKKLSANKERDQKNYKMLRDLGWTVMIIWECELKKDKRHDTLERLVDILYENYKAKKETKK